MANSWGRALRGIGGQAAASVMAGLPPDLAGIPPETLPVGLGGDALQDELEDPRLGEGRPVRSRCRRWRTPAEGTRRRRERHSQPAGWGA